MGLLLSSEFMLYGGLSSFFLWALFAVWFRKVTVDYIEAQMAKEGKSPPLWDRGIGGRISAYAVTIVRGKATDDIMVDDYSILKYARKKDWYLAVCFLSSFSIFLLFILVFYFVHGPAE